MIAKVDYQDVMTILGYLKTIVARYVLNIIKNTGDYLKLLLL